MGSTAKGLISGFICRLCSKMNRYVILIYGEEGERLGLADKINLYLPVTVTRNDLLPKTVCPNCVDRLEKHSQMVQMITNAQSKFNCHQDMLSHSSADDSPSFRNRGSGMGEDSSDNSDSESGEYSNPEKSNIRNNVT